MVEQLLPLPDGSRNQLAALLTRLADQVGLDGSFRAQVTGEVPPTPEGVKVFIAALRRTAPSLGLICQDTARALVLLASPLQEDQDVGYYYLTGNEVDLQDRRRWRINSTRKIPRLLVNEVSQLLALAGPIVLAIDQVDALIDELSAAAPPTRPEARPLADVATGLMALRDVAHRTLTIVSCLPESWEYIRKYGVDTVTDRFREARQLRNIPSADIGRLMIEKRFAVDFGRAGFSRRTRPGRRRPVRRRQQVHRPRPPQRILSGARRPVPAASRPIVELDRLDDWSCGLQQAHPAGAPAGSARPGRPRPSCSPGCGEQRRRSAPRSSRRPRTRRCRRCSRPASRPGPGKLGGADDQAFVQEPLPGKNPRLHACLRMLLDIRTERQRRWAFRAIASEQPAGGADPAQEGDRGRRPRRGRRGRRRAAGCSCSGRPRWPTGPVTEKAAAEFAAKGGEAAAGRRKRT